MRSPPGRDVAEWLIASCGVWHVGLGLYFIFVRPALLPEDIRYIAADAKTLQAVAPHLGDWLGKVFTVMGGFMAGAGVLIAYFGWIVLPTRPRWATFVLVVAGALTLVLMSAVNFALHSDFRGLLAAPPVAWFAAVWAYAWRRPGSGPKATSLTDRLGRRPVPSKTTRSWADSSVETPPNATRTDRPPAVPRRRK